MNNTKYTKAIVDYLDNFINDNEVANPVELLDEVTEAIEQLRQQYAAMKRFGL